MAINIGGTPFTALKQSINDSTDLHKINNEARLNTSDTLLPNIPAMKVSGRTFVTSFPDMTQIENDICSWW